MAFGLVVLWPNGLKAVYLYLEWKFIIALRPHAARAKVHGIFMLDCQFWSAAYDPGTCFDHELQLIIIIIIIIPIWMHGPHNNSILSRSTTVESNLISVTCNKHIL